MDISNFPRFLGTLKSFLVVLKVFNAVSDGKSSLLTDEIDSVAKYNLIRVKWKLSLDFLGGGKCGGGGLLQTQFSSRVFSSKAFEYGVAIILRFSR